VLQAGEIAEAVRSYEQAVRLAGKSAPGVYKLMGQLARRSAAGTGVAVDQLESSLPAVDVLPDHRIDELEDAAAGDPPSSPIAPKTMLLSGSVKSNLFMREACFTTAPFILSSSAALPVIRLTQCVCPVSIWVLEWIARVLEFEGMLCGLQLCRQLGGQATGGRGNAEEGGG